MVCAGFPTNLFGGSSLLLKAASTVEASAAASSSQESSLSPSGAQKRNLIIPAVGTKLHRFNIISDDANLLNLGALTEKNKKRVFMTEQELNSNHHHHHHVNISTSLQQKQQRQPIESESESESETKSKRETKPTSSSNLRKKRKLDLSLSIDTSMAPGGSSMNFNSANVSTNNVSNQTCIIEGCKIPVDTVFGICEFHKRLHSPACPSVSSSSSSYSSSFSSSSSSAAPSPSSSSLSSSRPVFSSGTSANVVVATGPSPRSGKYCTFQGCQKRAQGSTTLCKAHGGGKRCQAPGCTKAARGKSNHCISHGGGRRCETPGCSKSAVGATFHCVRHGGGRRCSFANCTKSARGGSKLCAKHNTMERKRLAELKERSNASAPSFLSVGQPQSQPQHSPPNLSGSSSSSRSTHTNFSIPAMLMAPSQSSSFVASTTGTQTPGRAASSLSISSSSSTNSTSSTSSSSSSSSLSSAGSATSRPNSPFSQSTSIIHTSASYAPTGQRNNTGLSGTMLESLGLSGFVPVPVPSQSQSQSQSAANLNNTTFPHPTTMPLDQRIRTTNSASLFVDMLLSGASTRSPRQVQSSRVPPQAPSPTMRLAPSEAGSEKDVSMDQLKAALALLQNKKE